VKLRYDTSTGARLPRLEIELGLREAHSLGTALLAAAKATADEKADPGVRRMRGIAERAMRVRLTLTMLEVEGITIALNGRAAGTPQTLSELVAAAVATRLAETLSLAQSHRGDLQALPRGWREVPTEEVPEQGDGS